MSTHRISPESGFCDTAKLPKGENGRALCRRCGAEVPPGRRSFCGQECIDLWKTKTSPSFVRQLLLKRDAGVCAECGLDCEAAQRELQEMAHNLEREGVSLYSLGQRWPVAGKAFFLRCAEIGVKPDRWFNSLWQADHIVPVVEGGGECGLDGYRTLCLRCHRSVTAELHRRLAKKRKEGAAA